MRRGYTKPKSALRSLQGSAGDLAALFAPKIFTYYIFATNLDGKVTDSRIEFFLQST